MGVSANDDSIVVGVPNGTVLDADLKGSAGVYAPAVGNAGKFFERCFTSDCAALEDVPGGMENRTETGGMSTRGAPDLQGMIVILLCRND